MDGEKIIKVIIADDHTIIAESLARMINLMENVEVIATCVNGKEAVEKAEKLHPDLVLMDVVMPIMNGVEATRCIKEAHKNIKVLMLTTFSERKLIYNAFEAGVDGYLLKDIKYEKLVTCIWDVLEGSFILPTEIAQKLVQKVTETEEEKQGVFNRTEMEIIELLKAGMTNKEIASELNISYGTTRNYISDIYKKTGESEREKVIKKLKG